MKKEEPTSSLDHEIVIIGKVTPFVYSTDMFG